MNKIKSYLGLSLKSNRVVIGQDRLKEYNKKVYLLVLSPNASNNLKDLAVRLKDKFNCPLIQTKENLEDIICRAGCKIIALTMESLAKAVLTQNNDYIEIKE